MTGCSHRTSRPQASPDICRLVADGRPIPDCLNEYTLYDFEDGELFPFLTAILSDDFLSLYGLNRETRSEIMSTPPGWLTALKPVCLDCLASLETGPLKRSCPPPLPQR
jgi:hypothetical protein